jgi:hypothetical protein
MALNWDLTDCKNREELTDEKNWGVTQAIILLSMSVGLGSITENNLDEWVKRLALIQAITGPMLQVSDGNNMHPWFITRSRIEELVGLKVNVTDESWNEFVKRQTTHLGSLIKQQEQANEALEKEISAHA